MFMEASDQLPVQGSMAATGPILTAETSMDAYADGAASQATAPLVGDTVVPLPPPTFSPDEGTTKAAGSADNEAAVAQDHGVGQNSLEGQRKVSGGLVIGTEDVKLIKPRSGLFSCCFSPTETLDHQEQVRISMQNDHTHHASALNGTFLSVCTFDCAPQS
jgi:hypothetical protein